MTEGRQKKREGRKAGRRPHASAALCLLPEEKPDLLAAALHGASLGLPLAVLYYALLSRQLVSQRLGAFIGRVVEPATHLVSHLTETERICRPLAIKREERHASESDELTRRFE